MNTVKNFLRLFSYLKGHRLLYLLALMFALLAQTAAALQPGLIKITVDSVLGNEPLTHSSLERLVALFGPAVKGMNGLLIMAALILAAALCRSVLTFYK